MIDFALHRFSCLYTNVQNRLSFIKQSGYIYSAVKGHHYAMFTALPVRMC